MGDIDASWTDRYMEPFDYFTVTSESMDQDFFEIEMTKALEEIFYNLRQLRASRYELEKRRLSSMDTDNELEDESFHHVEQTDNIDPEKETQSEKQDTDVVLLKESRCELNRRLSMDTEKNSDELEDESFSHDEEDEKVGTYSEEETSCFGSETDVVQLKEDGSRSELNTRLSMAAENNELEDECFQHDEQTENVGKNPEKETRSEQQDTDHDEAFQHDERTEKVESNSEHETTSEKQADDVVQVKLQVPRRRQLPLLPIVKKSL